MADDPFAELKAFEPKHDFFVGIDSDGCVFDTMEIKHKECFGPNIIEHWGLQAVSKYAREAFQFVNLYSKYRGVNRWPALKMVFDLLRERPDVQARGAAIPEGRAIQAFIDSDCVKSNDGLKDFIAQCTDPTMMDELLTAWGWTHSVNATIGRMVHGVPPFPYVRESLEKIAPRADVICVSATPGEALNREWVEHGIAGYAAVIAGQEMGKKAEHLCLCCGGERDGKGGVARRGTRYAENHVLMIGDAPGDRNAARENNALFFPVGPGEEDKWWKRFHDEAFDKFIAGEYAGEYEQSLNDEFEALLPEQPPWKRG